MKDTKGNNVVAMRLSLSRLLNLELVPAVSEGTKKVREWANKYPDEVVFNADSETATFQEECAVYTLSHDLDVNMEPVYKFRGETFCPHEVFVDSGWQSTVEAAFERFAVELAECQDIDDEELDALEENDAEDCDEYYDEDHVF